MKPDPHRALAEREKMPQPPYWLDPDSREVVLTALRQHCEHRGWNLLAAHVRTNHVHVVVEAEVQPERVMVEFKSYASRALNSLGLDGPDRRRWARHGSTRWLTLPCGRGSPLMLQFYVAHPDRDVGKAIQYVIESQGTPMALFVADGY